MKKSSKKVKMSRADIVFHIISYVLFSILIFVFAYPFYYLLICTISDNRMVNLNQIVLYPIGVHLDNYIEVFKLERIRTSAVISVLKTVLGTGGSLLVTSYMAYFFSKENMWHRKLFY